MGPPFIMRILLVAGLFAGLALVTTGQPILDRNWLNLAKDCAFLSNASYYTDYFGNIQSYTSFKHYVDAPQHETVLAQKNNRCYVAFRGTNFPDPADIYQNFENAPRIVCQNGNKDCSCGSKQGFTSGYYNTFRTQLEADLKSCMAQCTNVTDCLVITGHSQGGAIASVAAVLYGDYNPYLFSFAGLPSLSSQCNSLGLNLTRWYHFVNTRTRLLGELVYDPFAMLTPWNKDGLGALGEILIFSDGGMAAIDQSHWDSLKDFVLDATARAHSMSLYLPRVNDLASKNQQDSDYPLKLGYSKGSPCSSKLECSSGKCSGLFRKTCS